MVLYPSYGGTHRGPEAKWLHLCSHSQSVANPGLLSFLPTTVPFVDEPKWDGTWYISRLLLCDKYSPAKLKTTVYIYHHSQFLWVRNSQPTRLGSSASGVFLVTSQVSSGTGGSPSKMITHLAGKSVPAVGGRPQFPYMRASPADCSRVLATARPLPSPEHMISD